MNHKQANEPLAFSYSLSLLHFFNLFSFNILYIINQVSLMFHYRLHYFFF